MEDRKRITDEILGVKGLRELCQLCINVMSVI